MSFDTATREQLTKDADAILERYPRPKSALLPMLHLMQSVDGYVSPDGVAFCAEKLGIDAAEVSAVATFYTQFKRHPNGRYTVGVCTTSLCAIMGGDAIFDTLSDHLGVGNDETTEDGAITLERVECNAGCDYAPVMMVNWEFFDNQTPSSAVEVVEQLRSGSDVAPSRGADKVHSFKETERVLAGFLDDHANEGETAGVPTLAGVRYAAEHGYRAPHPDEADGTSVPTATGAEQVGTAGSSADRPVHSGADDQTSVSGKDESDD